DRRREQLEPRAGHLTERRPLVAEDARVAVLVGSDRGAEAKPRKGPRQDPHRVLEAGILRIRLDPLEVGLGSDALDLELRHERQQLTGTVRRDRYGPLRRQEPEAREVLDVLLVEEHPTREPFAGEVLE